MCSVPKLKALIEFLAESSLDCVNCIECKRDARPNIVSFANQNRLRPLKNKTNGHHQDMDYFSERLAIRPLFNGNCLIGYLSGKPRKMSTLESARATREGRYQGKFAIAAAMEFVVFSEK